MNFGPFNSAIYMLAGMIALLAILIVAGFWGLK
jgi:hypothetical protein